MNSIRSERLVLPTLRDPSQYLPQRQVVAPGEPFFMRDQKHAGSAVRRWARKTINQLLLRI